jgi:hypothetical protein
MGGGASDVLCNSSRRRQRGEEAAVELPHAARVALRHDSRVGWLIGAAEAASPFRAPHETALLRPTASATAAAAAEEEAVCVLPCSS